MHPKRVVIAAAVLAAAGWAAAEGLLGPNAQFPAWTLTDSTGATVSSQEMAGKTYLLWYYPKAMTSGCTTEGCELRDNYEGFRHASVEVIGVSFDSPEDNARFIKENNFPFRLLSDRDKTLAVAVGAADSTRRLYARRISYLVGPDGRVLKLYQDVDPKMHARRVLSDIAEMRATK